MNTIDDNQAPRCAWQGCACTGPLFAPRMNIPAQGHAIATHQPIKAILGFLLCDQHFCTATPELLLTDETKDIMTNLVSVQGKALPDFARAWVSKVSTNSPEYKNFIKAQVRANAAKD